METQNHASTPAEPIRITDESDLESTIDAYEMVLVDFYADWCGPCQMMESTIQELAAETEAAVVKVDVDQFQQLAAQYRVQGIPTVLLFANGEVADRMVGLQTADQLEAAIETHK